MANQGGDLQGVAKESKRIRVREGGIAPRILQRGRAGAWTHSDRSLKRLAAGHRIVFREWIR